MSGLLGKSNLGGGGGGLNFKISVHSAAPAEGQSGKENEIWVVSDTPSQHWAVKATEPVAADWGESIIPNGALWIVDDGTTNEFDAISNRKRYFGVGPANCGQYIDGQYQFLDAYLYRDGQWVQISFRVLPLFPNMWNSPSDWLKQGTEPDPGTGLSITGDRLVLTGGQHNQRFFRLTADSTNKVLLRAGSIIYCEALCNPRGSDSKITVGVASNHTGAADSMANVIASATDSGTNQNISIRVPISSDIEGYIFVSAYYKAKTVMSVSNIRVGWN